MKVLLVVKSKKMECLGVMYLKSVIQHNNNHDCLIVDLDHAYEIAVEWIPDIIGHSILTGDAKKFEYVDRCIRSTNHKNPPTVIVGGQDPSFFPEGYGWANMVIRGEAEQEMADLLKTGQVYGDIDSLPWPSRDDFPNMKVRDFISSRGCPYKCHYCYNARWAEQFPDKKGVRVRKAEDVINEIKSTNPEYVYFQDSCFGVNMEWMERFATRYSVMIDKPWQCNFRPEQITHERAALLSMSECVAIRNMRHD